MESPTLFNHRVTVPSVTDSPSAGMTTISLPALAAVVTGAGVGAGAVGAAGAGAGVATGGAAGVDCAAPSLITTRSAPTGTV